MDIPVAARHFEPPDEFKIEAEKRVNAVISKHFRNVLDAGAVFSLENSRFVSEINVKIKGTSFHAHDEDHNLHMSMEKAVKKLETQMRRYKDRKVSLKKKNRGSGEIDENS